MSLVDELSALAEETLSSISNATTSAELESIRVAVVGKSGSLTGYLRSMGQVPKDERAQVGKAVNAAREQGIKAGLVRPITLWPFPTRAIEAVVPTAKAFLDVEMNMGQMVEDVRLAVAGRVPVEFYGRTGGVIPTPDEVLAAIVALNEKVGE